MKSIPTIVGLGETLWDVFPDGPRLGGAPLNFCCSAAELAGKTAHVTIVSAVGHDKPGQAAIDAVQSHRVDTAYLQRNTHDTGQVLVELNAAGVASYRFADNGAWDHLEWNANLQSLASACDAVCFGTLGQRSPASLKTIQTFVAATPSAAMRILDVNLRTPFFNDEVILQSLTLANILKLNDEELPYLAQLCDLHGNDIELLRQLADRYQLQCVALTKGSDGAVLIRSDSNSSCSGATIEVADTVGAGDAFTAAMTLGLLEGKDIHTINQRAINVAAYVCSKPGATMSFPEHLRFDA